MVTFCKRKNCCVLGIAMLMPVLGVYAQQKNYSLYELIEAAGDHMPVIQQKKALLKGSEAVITDVKHSFLPRFTISDQVNTGTDNSIAGSYLPLTAVPSASAGVRDGNIYQPATGNIGALYGEYELINFGLNKARLKNAGAYKDLQQADLQRELYLLQLGVSRIYFNLLKLQYRLAADRQNTSRYDSIFNVIRALAVSGIKAGADSSLAKAELSRARIIYNQTLGGLNDLKEQLAYLTGMPASSFRSDSFAINFINNRPAPTSFRADTLNNPLMDFYVKKKNIFLSNEPVIRKSYLPRVVLAGSAWMRGSSIQYNDDYKSLATGLGYQRFNYMAGIGINYNLFNGLYKKDKLAINRFQVQATGFELEQERLQLVLSVSQSDIALNTAKVNLAELPVQLQSATDTYFQKLAQYKAGIISLIDLTNASFVLYRSQTDYIETVSDWCLAALEKAAATGNLNQFIQTIK